jgi:hypothetical protein
MTDLERILVDAIERLVSEHGDELKFVLIACDQDNLMSYCASPSAASEAVTMCGEVAMMYEGHKKGGRMS